MTSSMLSPREEFMTRLHRNFKTAIRTKEPELAEASLLAIHVAKLTPDKFFFLKMGMSLSWQGQESVTDQKIGHELNRISEMAFARWEKLKNE